MKRSSYHHSLIRRDLSCVFQDDNGVVTVDGDKRRKPLAMAGIRSIL